MSNVCVRSAWLTLDDGSMILLEDEDAGYYCTSLDLGSPNVREVMNDRPDQHGSDDRTQFFGSRAVSAEIQATQDIDDVATAFAPFMVPNLRPVLHYVLDRPGTPERTLVLRAASYSWPIVGASLRDIKLQWVAGDPIAKDPTQHIATAWAGSTAIPGRSYNLAFPRTYPPGAGVPTSSVIHSNGDVAVQPILRIFGPITQPVVTIHTPSGQVFTVGFVAGFTVGAGAWVDVDTKRKSAYYESDPNQNVISSLDWNNIVWPVLPVRVDNIMTIRGQNTTSSTQVQAIWYDGYLT